VARNARLDALESTVRIVRDRHAIPHIYARTVEDAVCALGYVHAQDRMWQMDMFRRMSQGRLAEILGESVLEQDIFCRTLGFKLAAEKCLAAMDDEALPFRSLTAYCRGVNARVESTPPDELPDYFKMLGYGMERWDPIDTVAFLRYVAWMLCGSFDDLWLLTVADKLGADGIDELFPHDRPYETPIVPDKKGSKPRLFRSEVPEDVPGLLDAAREILDRAQRTGFWQSANGGVGSNNWAVDGTKSSTGKPILCNDPHLAFSLPSLWYLAHLAADDLNVAGGTFPGIPGILVGRNDHIAWGLTNTQADVVDYFYERVHPKDESKYRHGARWRRFEVVEEEFAVRGAESRTVPIHISVHGPVLTREGQAVTMQWAGYEPSDEVRAFLEINCAKNFDDFLGALRNVGVPAQNFAYADKDGTIAIVPAGRFPIRKHGFGRVAHDGSGGQFDWRGFVPFEKLRYLLNPDCRYVASANQRPVGASFPYYLGWQWDAGYRARRINHLLAVNQVVSVEDMKRFQLDVHDGAAEAFLPALFLAFEGDEPDELTAKALALLKVWDCKATPDSVATTIWMSWFHSLRDAIWEPVWRGAGASPEGSWGFADENAWCPPVEVLEQILREQPDQAMPDRRDIPGGDALDALLRDTFRKALHALIIKAGEDMRAWKWGRFNRAKFESIADIEELSRKDIPIGGTVYTLSPGGKLREVESGATFRFIADFSNPDEALVIYPGGQSEDGSSPHYAEFIDGWAKGEYIQLLCYHSPERIPESHIESEMILEPT
jgi:penicillin amidase